MWYWSANNLIWQLSISQNGSLIDDSSSPSCMQKLTKWAPSCLTSSFARTRPRAIGRWRWWPRKYECMDSIGMGSTCRPPELHCKICHCLGYPQAGWWDSVPGNRSREHRGTVAGLGGGQECRANYAFRSRGRVRFHNANCTAVSQKGYLGTTQLIWWQIRWISQTFTVHGTWLTRFKSFDWINWWCTYMIAWHYSALDSQSYLWWIKLKLRW